MRQGGTHIWRPRTIIGFFLPPPTCPKNIGIYQVYIVFPPIWGISCSPSVRASYMETLLPLSLFRPRGPLSESLEKVGRSRRRESPRHFEIAKCKRRRVVWKMREFIPRPRPWQWSSIRSFWHQPQTTPHQGWENRTSIIGLLLFYSLALIPHAGWSIFVSWGFYLHLESYTNNITSINNNGENCSLVPFSTPSSSHPFSTTSLSMTEYDSGRAKGTNLFLSVNHCYDEDLQEVLYY